MPADEIYVYCFRVTERVTNTNVENTKIVLFVSVYLLKLYISETNM